MRLVVLFSPGFSGAKGVSKGVREEKWNKEDSKRLTGPKHDWATSASSSSTDGTRGEKVQFCFGVPIDSLVWKSVLTINFLWMPTIFKTSFVFKRRKQLIQV